MGHMGYIGNFIIIPTDEFHHFSEGLNHQPDEFFMIFDHLFAASDGQRLAHLADLRVGGGPRT
jgi:hypothetical protein